MGIPFDYRLVFRSTEWNFRLVSMRTLDLDITINTNSTAVSTDGNKEAKKKIDMRI